MWPSADVPEPHESARTMSDVRLSIPIKSTQQDGYVSGWASVTATPDGIPIIDHEDDFIPIAELEKAAHKLMVGGGRGRSGDIHLTRVGDIVESFIVSPEKKAAYGLDGMPEGWIVGMNITDPDAIRLVREGRRPELSIHGTTKRIPMGKREDGTQIYMRYGIEIDEVSIVDEGASGDDKYRPRVVLAKRKCPPWWRAKLSKILGGKSMPTLDEILAKLPEDEQKVILETLAQAAKPVEPQQPAEPPQQQPQPMQPVDKMGQEMQKVAEEGQEKREMAKRLAEAERRAAKLELAERRREVLSKVKGAKLVPGMSDEGVADMLIEAESALGRETFEAISKALGVKASAAAAILDDNKGTAAGSDERSKEERVEAMAKRLRKDRPELTKAKAYVEAYNELREEER